MTIGSAGVGTVTHLGIELLKREADIEVIHVPFRSTSENLSALLGGQIDALFGDVQLLGMAVRSGNIRALAVAVPQRVPDLAEIPTMAEAGLPGVVGETWFGFLVSAKTPVPIVRRLQDALAATHDDPVYRAKLASQRVSAGEPGPEPFARLLETEVARSRAIIAAAGIRLE
jgi:tripartite-type tricarboxylate transporter receptor subunit TctC